MKSSVEIVDALQRKLKSPTDYQLAKATGIHQATICSVRAGRCSLSRENCAKAAEILDVEVGALIAIVTAEREENPAIRASLLRVARKGMAAAALLVAVGMSAAPAPPARAATAEAKPMFIMSSRRRRTARREKTPVYTGTYPTAVRVKRPTLHLRVALPPSPTPTST